MVISLVRVQYRPPFHDEVRNFSSCRPREPRPYWRRAAFLAHRSAQSRPNSRGAGEDPSKERHRARNRSGTGEHVICFAKALPCLLWQPSDPDPASRASIAAWIAAEGLANVRAPVAIDTRQAIWGVEDEAPFAAMVSLNMIHIAPWGSALGLLAGAGRLLRPDGI